MENITINVTMETPMSEECMRIWDDIAERNTRAMYELAEMTKEQRKNLKCTVEIFQIHL